MVSFSSDWRFSPECSQEITDALIAADKNVTYLRVESDQGHDAFLLPDARYENGVSLYLNRVADQLEAEQP